MIYQNGVTCILSVLDCVRTAIVARASVACRKSLRRAVICPWQQISSNLLGEFLSNVLIFFQTFYLNILLKSVNKFRVFFLNVDSYGSDNFQTLLLRIAFELSNFSQISFSFVLTEVLFENFKSTIIWHKETTTTLIILEAGDRRAKRGESWDSGGGGGGVTVYWVPFTF